MSMQDLLSDFVARINNAVVAGQTGTVVIKNKLVINVCKKLTKLGYFASFEEGENYQVQVTFTGAKNKITKLKRISRPSRRIYTNYEDLPKIEGGIGWNILSTSKGILTNFEAKNEKTGGELLFSIY